jgi:hypothetical protein
LTFVAFASVVLVAQKTAEVSVVADDDVGSLVNVFVADVKEDVAAAVVVAAVAAAVAFVAAAVVAAVGDAIEIVVDGSVVEIVEIATVVALPARKHLAVSMIFAQQISLFLGKI